jgi:MoxR-like ATPase
MAILDRFRSRNPYTELQPAATVAEVLALQDAVPQVHVSRPVQQYMVDVVRATRSQSGVELGVSPRGTLALFRACQALAAVRGRDYVLPDDVQHLAIPVLAHRIISASQARLRGQGAQDVLTRVLAQVPVPAEPLSGVPEGGAS